jgi:cytochrome c-type biogenesis protein CcsB
MTRINIDFIYLITSLICWSIASFLAIKKKQKWAIFFQMLGVILFGVFIFTLWVHLQRPPFSTMGETRIWYSFFLSAIGGITYWRWKMSGLLTFTNLLASVFIIINICKPEMQSQALMPALQSVWFIPHVAVYIFAYAVMGCAFILAVGILFLTAKGAKDMQSTQRINALDSNSCAPCEKYSCTLRLNQLVKIGTISLGIGMCLGAIWAKKAWGQYWSWDIKENCALITWAIFLSYLHFQKIKKIDRKLLLILVIIGFLFLNFTWYGVKFLPSSKKSPHTFYALH